MIFEKHIQKLTKPSILLIIAITSFAIITMDGWRSWNKGDGNFSWDVANYYSYLPAFFTNSGSFELKTECPSFKVDYMPILPRDSLHIPKTTYGMALFYSPFFALGYKIAYNQQDPLDGFSEAFATTLHWGMIFYSILGLLLLRNFLIKFFTEKVITITLIILFFGTALFYYSLSQPEMPHSSLFFLFSAFLLSTYHWYLNQTIGRSLLIGFLIGLIALIRPTDLMIGLVFLFWPTEGCLSFKDKMMFLLKRYKLILVMASSALLMWVPQMLFWKARTGHLLYFSYQGEQFFWNDPQLINVLFSYRKGLFLYTPLIALSIIGFCFMPKSMKQIRNGLILLFVLNLYLVSCWWDWFFGGCFAARSFVQHFSYLSIPLASLIAFMFELPSKTWIKPIIQFVLVVCILLGISLNLFQTYQYNANLIHPFAMSKKTYWFVFGRYNLKGNEQYEFWGGLKEPNYEKLRSGEDRDQ